MKNVKKNVVSFLTEKKSNLKKPIKNLDSISSFKTSKLIKSKVKMAPSNFSILKRNSQLLSEGKNKGNFITVRPKNIPKNVKPVINDIRTKKLKDLKPLKLIIKYARNKIKKDYNSPYISRLFKINKEVFKTKKEEDKPICYNLYKINDIFDKKKSRFNINFLENNIFLSENEYLIKSFNKKEIKIIFRYLLGYIFIKDKYSLSKSDRYNHKTKIVYSEFFDYIENDYTLIDPDNQINPILTNQKNARENSSTRINLLTLSLNVERDKINYPFLKTPNYFLIKDMPKKFVPNAIPNYYFNGNIFHILIKKSAFYKRFNINYEIITNMNKNIFDKTRNEIYNSSFIAKDKLVNFVDNISKDSSMSEQSFLNTNYINKSKLSRDKDIVREQDTNIQNDELLKIKKLIKNFEEKNETKKVHFQKREMSSRQKKHITIRKKKQIRQPWEDYEIIQTDDFLIKKRDKSNILQIINNEILNSTYDKQRNKRKHKTRFLTKKQNRNIENMKTFSNNETFRRKNRFFLTTHANQNFFVNKEFPFFNNSRNKILSIYKRNILMN